MLVAIRNTGAVLALAVLAGCGGVSKEKYDAAVSDADKYKQTATTEAQRLQACEQKASSLGGQVQGLQQSNTAAAQTVDDYQAVNSALVDANATNLVEIARLSGLATIRVPEKLLFAPGSAAITKSGKAGLKKIAAAMKQISGRAFYVAGNTDSKPIKTKQFPSNWELSTARAVTVVHFFASEGVDPKMLGAAGFASYHPVAANDTAEGRARNRRIDIGIAPPVSDLPTVSQ